MNSLKKKFGKFAVSTEKMAMVSGGNTLQNATLTCYSISDAELRRAKAEKREPKYDAFYTGDQDTAFLACQGNPECVTCSN